MNHFHRRFSAQIAASAAPDDLCTLPPAAGTTIQSCFIVSAGFFCVTPSLCKPAKAKEILLRFDVYGGVNGGSAFNHLSSNNS